MPQPDDFAHDDPIINRNAPAVLYADAQLAEIVAEHGLQRALAAARRHRAYCEIGSPEHAAASRRCAVLAGRIEARRVGRMA